MGELIARIIILMNNLLLFFFKLHNFWEGREPLVVNALNDSGGMDREIGRGRIH